MLFPELADDTSPLPFSSLILLRTVFPWSLAARNPILLLHSSYRCCILASISFLLSWKYYEYRTVIRHPMDSRNTNPYGYGSWEYSTPVAYNHIIQCILALAAASKVTTLLSWVGYEWKGRREGGRNSGDRVKRGGVKGG